MLLSENSRAKRLDGVTYLTVFLVAAFAIESRYVVGPLGAAGTPAQLIALTGLGWWLYYQVQRTHSDGWMVHPVRIGLFALLLAYMASFVAAMARPIDGVETSSATLGMVGVLGWLGIGLLAHDGVPTHERFDVLVRRLVLATALLGALGVAQFLTHDSLIRWFTIPGLQTSAPLGDLMSRAGFTRPAGTALHPIEFGAVLTTVLPIAIARARTHAAGRHPGAWLCVLAIALGIVVSGSRSAILAALVGLVVLGAAWSYRTRMMAVVLVGILLGFVAVALPGVSGSLFKLFTGFAEDGSTQSRTGSYTIVSEFFERQPWFGRGPSTFLPSYRILDNQYLLLLVDIGIVGLLVFLALMFAAIGSAWAARRLSTNRGTKEMAQSLSAAVAAAGFGLGTYDGFSFPMGTSVLFLVIGLSGTIWRLVRLEDCDSGPSIPDLGYFDSAESDLR
ncbi:O-antigen ligase family protein [Nocardioides sp. JQ2195]|uniref:O-antigen ligase family protein n=1 Tax=Nocardioides sp. JQ2195 TaxID=2592334 RepID=UPI00143EC6CF|nr:O-antigen ligase family protein [Nocardioides sp. JQ2195]QIX27855.1 O-antigen ligase family protein [Nocardioides sp. JQ2195]